MKPDRVFYLSGGLVLFWTEYKEEKETDKSSTNYSCDLRHKTIFSGFSVIPPLQILKTVFI